MNVRYVKFVEKALSPRSAILVLLVSIFCLTWAFAHSAYAAEASEEVEVEVAAEAETDGEGDEAIEVEVEGESESAEAAEADADEVEAEAELEEEAEAQTQIDEEYGDASEADEESGDASEADEESVLLGTLATTAEELSSGATYITIDSSVLSSSWIEASGSNIVANEARNGIYFLYGTRLLFLSLDDYTCTVEYVFSRVSASYMTDSLLYVLDESSGAVVYVYDLDENALDGTIDVSSVYDNDGVSDITCIGVDGSGRIYLATDGYLDGTEVFQLWLYSASGSLLSSASIDMYVYSFAGFADDGSFFMETEYNWVYWGYDHYGNAATMGTVTDNQISFTQTSGSVTVSGLLTYSLSCIEYLCQYSYYYHEKAADVIGGKYLVTTSTTYGRLIVWDVDSLSSVISISREAIEQDQSDTWTDENSVGVRTVYNESNDSIIVYENDKVLNEYDPDTGEIIGTYSTQHYVYCLMMMGDDVVALEMEDGEYYIEVINWVAPSSFKISASTTTMKVGQSQQLTLNSSADYEPAYTWTTSDASIVSVTDEGKISSWSEGTATISYTSNDGTKSTSITITVSGSTTTTPSSITTSLSGTVTDNESDHDYSVWSSVVDSYIVENDDGTFMRVEYTDDAVLVETYSSSYKLTSSQTISMELSIFGGFYAGEDYYYLVFGQSNYSESSSVEVIRVVKYTKSWTRVSACSIYGANTYYPFDAGTVSMTELDGTLYIYTCHTMWSSTSGDGVNHQANMTFVIDESSMTVTDSYYDILNISQAGYVSHSFNQIVRTDGEYIYRVDHGDGYPRAVSITKTAVGDDITDVTYTYALTIQGSTGANATGVSVGGMELSDENILIVGNSVDQSDSSSYSASGQRNIFLTVTDKTYLTTEEIWLTDYDEDDDVTPGTPQIVKLADDRFLIMWEETYENSGQVVTRMVTVNGDGDITSDITCTSARLSDCQPIVTSAGLVVWYVTDGSSATMYTINPYDLPSDLSVSAVRAANTASSSSGSSSSSSSDSTYYLFFDVLDTSKYWFEAVYAIAEEGWMTGKETNWFGVEDALTRAQMVTVLWRIACPDDYAAYTSSVQKATVNTTGMDDVADGKYYTAAVNWAVENGIITGKVADDGTRYFDPNGECTFQQFCTILARYLAGGDDALEAALTSSQVSSTLAKFSDTSSIADYARKAVAYCVYYGAVDGKANGTIAPTETVIRGRCVTVLYKALNAGLIS